MIIIHTGANGIQNKVNALQKVRKVITTIKETDVNNEIQIAFSSVIHRNDQDFEEEIKEINRKLENLCKGKEINFHRLWSQIDYAVLTIVLLIKQPTLLLPVIPAMFHF